ncbi:MAG: hypothetical protein R6U96_02680 [Promethearchaeia archaeon]
MTVTQKKKKSPGMFKTIRFNEEERIIYECWDFRMVRKFKKFMKQQLKWKQKIRFQIENSNKPEKELNKLIKEKLELLRFLMKQNAKNKTIKKVSKKIKYLKKFPLKNTTENEN